MASFSLFSLIMKSIKDVVDESKSKEGKLVKTREQR